MPLGVTPARPPCIREEQVDCVLYRVWTCEASFREDVLPTSEQTGTLLKDHRQTSRRGNKVQTEPISDDESLIGLLIWAKKVKLF